MIRRWWTGWLMCVGPRLGWWKPPAAPDSGRETDLCLYYSVISALAAGAQSIPDHHDFTEWPPGAGWQCRG